MRLKGLGPAIFAVACALGAAASTGCATTKNKTADGRDYEVVCNEEAPTGSNISRFRCYKKWQVEDRRAQDRAAMEKIQFDSKRPAIQGPGSSGSRLLVPSSGGGPPMVTASNAVARNGR